METRRRGSPRPVAPCWCLHFCIFRRVGATWQHPASATERCSHEAKGSRDPGAAGLFDCSHLVRCITGPILLPLVVEVMLPLNSGKKKKKPEFCKFIILSSVLRVRTIRTTTQNYSPWVRAKRSLQAPGAPARPSQQRWPRRCRPPAGARAGRRSALPGAGGGRRAPAARRHARNARARGFVSGGGGARGGVTS